MINWLVFSIEGWEADPRKIQAILEVRRFFCAFHEAWSYWLYFCNLRLAPDCGVAAKDAKHLRWNSPSSDLFRKRCLPLRCCQY